MYALKQVSFSTQGRYFDRHEGYPLKAKPLFFANSTIATLMGFGLLAAIVAAPAHSQLARQPQLVDETSRWGLLHSHRQRRETITGATETLGAGACVLDFDGDGWMDLLLLTGSGEVRPHGKDSWWRANWPSQRLYRNRQGLRFDDVTSSALPDLSIWSMGCAVGDLDNDGDPDLVLTGYGSTRLLQNDDGQQFTDITTTAGIADSHWATGATLADFNDDGLLDIYVSGLVTYRRNQRTFEALRGFSPTIPPAFNLALYDAIPNQHFINQRGMRFVQPPLIGPLADAAGRGLASRWIRRPGDAHGWLQLFNSAHSPTTSLQRHADGYAASSIGYQTTEGLHYLAEGDIDADGELETLATAPEGNPLQLQDPGSATGDRLVWERGIARLPDLARNTWDISLADWNLDGYPDIALANGRLTPDPDAPELPHGQPNQVRLYSPAGFADVSLPSPNGSSSRAAIRADFNNDGRSDLLFTNNNERPRLLINRTPHTNPWLGVSVRDERGRPITQAVEIRWHTGDTPQIQPRHADQSFLSRHDPRALFSARSGQTSNSVEIVWPDGRRSHHANLAPDQYHIISPTGTTANTAAPKPFDTRQLVARYRALGALYLHLLTQSLDHLDSSTVLWLYDQLAQDAEALSQVLRYFPHEPSPALQPIAEMALRSDKPSTLVAGLRVAKQWESEQLLRLVGELLFHASDTVVCETARVLQHFFAEEEAVIHSKYLAVPSLIKVLTAASSEKQRCALLALSEVEHYRGSQAILRLAQSANDHVAVTAIFTLGKRRQTTAIPVLEEIAAGPTKHRARQQAARDALQRLSAQPITPAAATPLHTHAALMAMLAANGGVPTAPGVITGGAGTDSVVETPSQVELAASSRTQRQQLARMANQSTPTDEILEVLGRLEDVPASHALRILNTVLRHPSPAVRTAAIQASMDYLDDERLTKRLWHLMHSDTYPQASKTIVAWVLGTRSPQDVLSSLES